MEDTKKPVEQSKVQSKEQSNSEAEKSPLHDFERLTDGLKTAMRKFQDDQTPENFAVIVSSLSEFGISGADVWHQVASYSKKNPVRVALLAGLAFFALRGLIPAAKARMDQGTVH